MTCGRSVCSGGTPAGRRRPSPTAARSLSSSSTAFSPASPWRSHSLLLPRCSRSLVDGSDLLSDVMKAGSMKI